jgi:sugar O-acyltransferase (sialic acid O-acetyltransferase NeuD family)
MVIIGSKGLAKELLVALEWDGEANNLCLFDNVNQDTPDVLYGRFRVIKSWDDLQDHFIKESPDFALGVGGQKARKFCAEKAVSLGGKLRSIISKHALIGDFGVSIGSGVCILSHVTVTADVVIGEGTLINKSAIISHDSAIGSYCEISPGAKILGRTKIGDRTEIGTNAVILPDVVVGCDCRVGAGAVVTKNVQDGLTVAGIPAKPLPKKAS